MSTLVTGGCGYIGSHTVLQLLEQNEEVIVVDNFSNSSPDILNQINNISNKDFYFYEVDIRDKDSLESILLKHNIDSLIHFAALKSIPDSFEKEDEYYDVNIQGTIVITDLIRRFNIETFIFSSSAAVYGSPESLPIKEDCVLDPQNPYAITKMKGEEISKQLYLENQLKHVYVLRYFNPIGAHSSGLIGENITRDSTNLVPLICKVLMNKMKHLKVYGSDYETKDGTGIRDYIHINDLVRGHLSALNHARSNKKGNFEIINLGTGIGYSVLEVISAFEKITNKTIPYIKTSRREGDIAECYADVKLAENIIGWSSEYNLLEMCNDTWNWASYNLVK